MITTPLPTRWIRRCADALDPELIYAVFRLRMYAGRIDSAAELAPAVLATRRRAMASPIS